MSGYMDKVWITPYENAYLVSRISWAPVDEASPIEAYLAREAQAQAADQKILGLPQAARRLMQQEPVTAYSQSFTREGVLGILAEALGAIRPPELALGFGAGTYPTNAWSNEQIPPWATFHRITPGLFCVELSAARAWKAEAFAAGMESVFEVEKDEKGFRSFRVNRSAIEKALRGGAAAQSKRYLFTTAEGVLAFVRDRLPELPVTQGAEETA